MLMLLHLTCEHTQMFLTFGKGNMKIMMANITFLPLIYYKRGGL